MADRASTRSLPVIESDVERDACERIALELGVHGLKLSIDGETGWPDRVFLIPGGRPLFVEFKRPGDIGKSRPRQVFIHRSLRILGYEVYVFDTAEAAIEQVRYALAQWRREVEAASVSKDRGEVSP